MKTIEERAKEYPFDFSSDEAKAYIEIGYIGGATEQKEIDDKIAFEERQKAFIAGYNSAIEKLKIILKTTVLSRSKTLLTERILKAMVEE